MLVHASSADSEMRRLEEERGQNDVEGWSWTPSTTRGPTSIDQLLTNEQLELSETFSIDVPIPPSLTLPIWERDQRVISSGHEHLGSMGPSRANLRRSSNEARTLEPPRPLEAPQVHSTLPQLTPPPLHQVSFGTFRRDAQAKLLPDAAAAERAIQDLHDSLTQEICVLCTHFGYRRTCMEISSDLPLMEAVLRDHPLFFKRYGQILSDNSPIVLIALRLQRCTLEDLSSRLRNDPKVALLGLRFDRSNRQYLGARLMRDGEFLLSVIWEHGSDVLQSAGQELLSSGAFILKAMANDPTAIRFADRTLLANWDFGLKALSLDFSALSALVQPLVENPHFITRALEQTPAVIRPLLQRELHCERRKEIALWALQANCMVFAKLSEEMRKDWSFIESAVGCNVAILQFVDWPLRSERALLKRLVRIDGLALEYAATFLKRDGEIAEIAVVQNSTAWNFVDDQLRADRGFILSALVKMERPISRIELWDLLDKTMQADQEILQLVFGEALYFAPITVT